MPICFARHQTAWQPETMLASSDNQRATIPIASNHTLQLFDIQSVMNSESSIRVRCIPAWLPSCPRSKAATVFHSPLAKLRLATVQYPMCVCVWA